MVNQSIGNDTIPSELIKYGGKYISKIYTKYAKTYGKQRYGQTNGQNL